MSNIREIVEEEWSQFQKVNNEGGRASCQDDGKTFYIMRKSQFLVWPEEVLDSYYGDLCKAREEGKNLLFYKYAFMMERTASDPCIPGSTRPNFDRDVSERGIVFLWRTHRNVIFPIYSGVCGSEQKSGGSYQR